MQFLDKRVHATMAVLMEKVSRMAWLGWGDVLNLIALLSFAAYLTFFLGLRILLDSSGFEWIVSVVIFFFAMYTMYKYWMIKKIFRHERRALEWAVKSYRPASSSYAPNTSITLTSMTILTGILGVHAYMKLPAFLPSPVWIVGFDLMWLYLFGRFVSYLFSVAMSVYLGTLDELPELISASPVDEAKAAETKTEDVNKKE